MHHPAYFTRNSALALTYWLPKLLEGKLPKHWAADSSELCYILEDVRNTSYSSISKKRI